MCGSGEFGAQRLVAKSHGVSKDRSVRGVRSLGAPDSIKVTKKLVCAVEQVNDHSCQELFMR